MVRCKVCAPTKNFRSKGWFTRHMVREHNWQIYDAEGYFDAPDSRCPKCGKVKINTLYCNNCGHMFQPFRGVEK